MIDDASHQDLPEILAIYNEVIRNSTAVYLELEFSPERGESWFDSKRSGGFPFIVSKDRSGVTGFGTFADFRAPHCYRHTVEHSVHVRRDCRGKGIGRELVTELMARACALQKHIMIAGIDADNVASIRLHLSLGFVNVGHFYEVGFKFGRWLDLVFLQCRLPATKPTQL